MENLNNKLMIILSGNKRAKKELAYLLLENNQSFKIIDDKNINQYIARNVDEYNIVYTKEDAIKKIVSTQQRRGIPSIIFADISLCDVMKNSKNVLHININETESKSEILILEYGVKFDFDDLKLASEKVLALCGLCACSNETIELS